MAREGVGRCMDLDPMYPNVKCHMHHATLSVGVSKLGSSRLRLPVPVCLSVVYVLLVHIYCDGQVEVTAKTVVNDTVVGQNTIRHYEAK
jgi:hypothetical protein